LAERGDEGEQARQRSSNQHFNYRSCQIYSFASRCIDAAESGIVPVHRMKNFFNLVVPNSYEFPLACFHWLEQLRAEDSYLGQTIMSADPEM